MRTLRRLHGILAVALGLFAVGLPQAAPAIELEAVLAYLGFDAEAKRDIRAGKVVSRRIQEGPEKTELAISVAALFSASLDEALASVRKAEVFEADANVVAYHEIRSWPPKAADFAGLGFGAEEASEVGKLLTFDGGSSLNLSSQEIARFRALRDRYRDGSDPAAREAVAAVYREVLRERYRAYRERGLEGIAAYDRGRGRQVDPGEKLRLAASASTFFRENEPELYAAFSEFPKAQGAGVEHRFYWIKQRVQDRPTLILSHRMFVQRPGSVIVAERHYYIGHSYNSVQLVNAGLPVEKGLVLLYTNRTSIDQLAGMTGRVARPIAAGRLSERVASRFETLRARAR